MSFNPQIDDRLEPIIRRVATHRDQGLRDLEALAVQGDKSAIVYLGLYLSETESTSDAAEKWLLLASEFGSPDAAWNLAMIARSQGSIDKMRLWIDRAAELGEEDARAARNNGYNIERILSSLRE